MLNSEQKWQKFRRTLQRERLVSEKGSSCKQVKEWRINNQEGGIVQQTEWAGQRAEWLKSELVEAVERAEEVKEEW